MPRELTLTENPVWSPVGGWTVVKPLLSGKLLQPPGSQTVMVTHPFGPCQIGTEAVLVAWAAQDPLTLAQAFPLQ